MIDSRCNFIKILRKTIVANNLQQYKSYSINWFYQRYLDSLMKSIGENETLQTTDKILKRLTRFYIDNEANCELLAKTYEDIRRGYFLYKNSKFKKGNN